LVNQVVSLYCNPEKENTVESPLDALLVELIKRNSIVYGVDVSMKLHCGRISPYYLDLRSFCDAKSITLLGKILADAVELHFGEAFDFDYVVGQAYKGIPLAMALALEWEKRKPRLSPVGFLFKRKENKTSGEAVSGHIKDGHFIGPDIPPGKRVLIVDDVLTTGSTVRECIEGLDSVNPDYKKINIVGLLTCVDRQELDEDLKPIRTHIYNNGQAPELELQRHSIINATQIMDFLVIKNLIPQNGPVFNKISAYYSMFILQKDLGH
jgi:orotate phosphoribosyltransferase